MANFRILLSVWIHLKTSIKWLFHLRKSRANATNCPEDGRQSSWSICFTGARKCHHHATLCHCVLWCCNAKDKGNAPKEATELRRGSTKRNVNICIYDFCGWLIWCWVCKSRGQGCSRSGFWIMEWVWTLTTLSFPGRLPHGSRILTVLLKTNTKQTSFVLGNSGRQTASTWGRLQLT